MQSQLVIFALVLFAACAQASARRGAWGLRPVNCTGPCQRGDDEALMNRVMKIKNAEWHACIAAGECPRQLQNILGAETPCVNGRAGEYPCKNVDLLSYVSLPSLGSNGDGNDIWGWTDPQDGKEYAIVGTETGTSFVDVTNPTSPVVLGFLPTHTVGSLWRDIKVYKNHAFIVSEATNHGMQVYDLTQLRNLPRVNIVDQTAVPIFEATAHYAEFGSAHNLVINEETGYAFSVGSRTCSAGLHIVNIQDPVNPTFVACYGDDGYVHDAQCVIYRGPDVQYRNKEVCFCYNEDSLTIVDVTDKDNMVEISRTEYQGSQYTHQGWNLPNSGWLLLNDELDEIYGSNKHTRTLLWDTHQLRAPKSTYSFYSSETSVDHNLYTLGNYAYLANYCAGLRVMDTSQVASGGGLTEAGYFDVAPDCSTTSFFGSWSVYPYFPSGNIVVNSIERGLFVVKFTPAN
jgi:choice-of-anchor B domain-containing protein